MSVPVILSVLYTMFIYIFYLRFSRFNPTSALVVIIPLHRSPIKWRGYRFASAFEWFESYRERLVRISEKEHRTGHRTGHHTAENEPAKN